LTYVTGALLLAGLPMQAEQKVQIVANFDVDYLQLNHALTHHHFDGRAVPSNLTEYGEGLVKKRTRWAKLLRKFHLDYPKRVDVPDDVAKIVFFNTTVHYRRDLCLNKLPKEKLVLFMWEPLTVLNKMYRQETADCYSRVYTFDDDLVDNQRYFKFYYPRMRPMTEEVVPFDQKKLCTLVSTNIYNKYPIELYSERRKAIDFFERHAPDDFAFYGKGWDPSCYKTYQGPVADKIAAVKNYKFSICYENCQSVKGYITEKIFDCFAAGNVPVYWGAPNITDYIPKECFIDRRDFHSMEELYTFLKEMPEDVYNGYLQRIRDYLASDKAQLYAPAHFEKIFFEAVTAR
jgi:hypothetical protein